MKSILSISLILISAASASAAKLSCPEGSRQLRDCRSTPARGDSEFAASVLNRILICRSESSTALVMQNSEGKTDSSIATEESRMGGATFSVQEKNVVMSISLPMATAPGYPVEAKFNVTFTKAKLSGTSTYTCK